VSGATQAAGYLRVSVRNGPLRTRVQWFCYADWRGFTRKSNHYHQCDHPARGLVFVLVGIFAAMAATGARTRAADTKDALRALLDEPFGHALLALIAAGLLCFAAWRLTQAALDADDCGTSLEGLVRRAIYAGSALFYLGFAWVAVNMLFGSDRNGNSDQIAREWSLGC
jgi:hypothetical protein